MEIARCRDQTVVAQRQRRREMRKLSRKNIGIKNIEDPAGKLDRDKVRALISAIRVHTNSDIDFNVDMSPTTLFRQANTALNGPCTRHAAKESRFIGEALECVQKLNSMLSRR
jgi:hypothetical protein